MKKLQILGTGCAKCTKLAEATQAAADQLGVAFALAFCPLSAALFFGSLIPMATAHGSPFVLPALYGIGTAVPVLGFAILIAVGAASLGATFERLQRIERWARPVTAIVFLGTGIFETLRGVFHVL